jgi:hypothetical protein
MYAARPHPCRRASTVDKELAWYRSRAQHPPVHVEEIAARGCNPNRAAASASVVPSTRCAGRPATVTVNARARFPRRATRRERPDDCDDDHDQTRNDHAPQHHHAHSSFVIRKTSLPAQASTITRSYVPAAATSPWTGSSASRCRLRRATAPRRVRIDPRSLRYLELADRSAASPPAGTSLGCRGRCVPPAGIARSPPESKQDG